MRVLRNRRLKIGVLIALPVALFLVARERVSWRPRVLPHGSMVMSVAFSPAGEMLASATVGKVVLWNPETQERLRTLPANPFAWFRSVSFSSDGRILATAGSGQGPQLWDTRTGKLRRSMDSRQISRSSCALSPDGKLVAGWEPGSNRADVVAVWDASTGASTGALQNRLSYTARKNSLQCVDAAAFSPDGKVLAVAGWAGNRGNGYVQLWDARTQKLRRVLRGLSCGRFGMPSLAFSPDGRLLAAPAAHTVKIWDARTGHLQRTLRGFEDETMAVAFSPDGRTLAVASGTASSLVGQHGIRLWDIQTATVRRTFGGFRGEARCLAFSPDGATLAAAHTDNAVRLWRVK